MLTAGINFLNFKEKKKSLIVRKKLKLILQKKNAVIQSLCKDYINSYNKKDIQRYKKLTNFRIIGMGGSTLGSQAIYDFLNHKIKKKFIFIDNLDVNKKKKKEKKYTNIVISKSGNTVETITNSNIFIKNKEKNIFITENKNSYLFQLANKLKAEIIHHNNFIG